MCPIPNGFGDSAVSLYSLQTSNTLCAHTGIKVDRCWQNFKKCIMLGKLYEFYHLNSENRY
jgi:hypothetical protein